MISFIAFHLNFVLQRVYVKLHNFPKFSSNFPLVHYNHISVRKTDTQFDKFRNYIRKSVT